MTSPPPRLALPVTLAPAFLVAIFVGAASLRVAYVLAMHASLGVEGLLGPDSQRYLLIARIAAETGALMEPGPGGALQEQTMSMPLYLLWLALHQVLFADGGALAAALCQAGIDAGTCVLIVLLAHEIDPGVAPLAGVLAAVSPTLVVMCGLIYTDSFFLFWTTLALYAGVRWLREGRWMWAIALGLALGLGLATRAVLLVWVPFVLGLLFLRGWWRGRRVLRAAAQTAAALSVVVAIQAPLLVHNYTTYGAAKLTSQGGTHALLWIVPLVREAADGMSHAEGARLAQELFNSRHYRVDPDNPFAVSAAMGRLAVELLVQLGPAAIAKAWSVGAAINLASPAALLSPPVSRLPRTGFFDTPGSSKLEKIINFLWHNDNALYGQILIGAGAASGLALLLTAFGIAEAWRRHPEGRFMVLSLGIWVAYILAVHGPVASPKYRLPAEPALLIFLAFGVRAVVRLCVRRGGARVAHAR